MISEIDTVQIADQLRHDNHSVAILMIVSKINEMIRERYS